MVELRQLLYLMSLSLQLSEAMTVDVTGLVALRVFLLAFKLLGIHTFVLLRVKAAVADLNLTLQSSLIRLNLD